MNVDISNINLYDLFEIENDATLKDIKKAYRKKALHCHPDKNPDDPIAAELFLKLTKALEVLTDENSRKAYDRVLETKRLAEIRRKHLDSVSKKFKDDLDLREKEAEEQILLEQSKRRLEKEIERLRKEGSKIIEEEQELLRKSFQETQNVINEEVLPRMKLKWKKATSYSEEILREMFSKYGEVQHLIVSKKKTSCLIEYKCVYPECAVIYEQRGIAEDPLNSDWLILPSVDHHTDNDEYQRLVMENAIKAQEKRKQAQ